MESNHLHLGLQPNALPVELTSQVGEVGLEPTMFLCHGFTDRYPRRWVTPPKQTHKESNPNPLIWSQMFYHYTIRP